MIYKFKSKATGDVLMLEPHGNQLLALIGREPSSKGIIPPDAMPSAIEHLTRAVQEDETRPAEEPQPADQDGHVSLRRRVWPMIDMMRRAHAADEPIVWGV